MPVVCSYQTPAEDLGFSQKGLKDPTGIAPISSVNFLLTYSMLAAIGMSG
jgi:hypothetical protein